MRQPNRVGVVYAFSEANHAVFQNAGIWRLREEFGIEAHVYAPKEYLGLYWAATQRFLISPSPYASMSEIQQYEKSPIQRRKISSWFSSGGVNYFYNLFLDMLPTVIFHSLPKYFTADYKSRKFLFKSGIYRLCKKHFLRGNHEGNAIFLGTTMYTNPGNGRKFRRNLTRHFQESFENLFQQISTGCFADFPSWTEQDTFRDIEINPIFEFFKLSGKTVFLRTRNLNNSVRFQNASADKIRPVVLYLLNNGIKVVNSGTPPVSLDITHSGYFEFSHKLPVDEELRIASLCNFVMNSAWAGLFVAVATLRKNLITFDREWSEVHLSSPISILDARKKAGQKDLVLGDMLNSHNSADIATLILDYCNSFD